MTFSIVGRCPRTGQLGAAIASSSPAVAARCLWARAGVGAVSTQNLTDPSLGIQVLERLGTGERAQAALENVLQATPHRQYRQVTVIDSWGETGVFSGERTLGVFATVEGDNCAAAGNLLANERIPSVMVERFLTLRDLSLGERLVAALEAGVEEGGEVGPVHSAGLIVVDRVPWPVTDLRVDWSESPVGALRGLWELWEPQAEAYLQRALDPSAAPPFGVPGESDQL